jgi:hypothetical protein
MTQKTNNFKFGDKVRVLRGGNGDAWKTLYYGVILQASNNSNFVQVWDPEKRDGNCGDPQISNEWVNCDCRMTRVIRD